MAATWDPVRMKAQLRLAAQRLGQLQDRKDSVAQITRRDIATLLQTRNLPLARAKTQKLMREDAVGDLQELLEMHCGIILEQFGELEKSELHLNPAIIESASSIIFAAPQSESKDLNVVRDMLIARIGPDFARSAVNNADRHVSPRILQAVSPPSSAADVEEYLLQIARSFNVDWQPEMRPHEKLNAISELLDISDQLTVIDIPKLRHISSSGIPHHPPWLRPRIWKLLLGTLPPSKQQWATESRKQRESYYDLIRRLLTPIADYPPPTVPLSSTDRSLANLWSDLTRVPPALFSGLEDEPELSSLCPLHDIASPDIWIDCAVSLDYRMSLIGEKVSKKEESMGTPEIRLELDDDAPNAADTSVFEQDTPERQRPSIPTTLHPSKAFKTGGAHPKHLSALLRLLFVHSSLHPANHSPHIASLLVPLYSVLYQEIEQSELAHAEADAFWLFEALVGEVAELEEEEGGNLWMRKFGERVMWADEELFADLHKKGLDPGLPHYSYRWLAPILTHTLPLSSVLVVWDAILSQPSRLRTSNPKLDYLLDICAGMLIRTRVRLLRLGKSGHRPPSLWDDESDSITPPSPVRPWELGDAFMEGMTLLQVYPVQEAGGIEQILQVAADLANRREEELNTQKTDTLTLTEKLRNTVWRGLTNQAPSSDDSPIEEDAPEEEDAEGEDSRNDDGNETEPSGFSSRLRNTVWRGITNQSSMDAPPSPLSPLSPIPSPRPSPKRELSVSPQSISPAPEASTSLWSYAEKLKESDMAAQLSKVSSNWTIKAIGTWNARSEKAASPTVAQSQSTSAKARMGSISLGVPHLRGDESRRGSLPNIDRTDVYSPPTRPAYFRPPRDSWMLQPQKGPLLSVPNSPESPASPLSLSDTTLDTTRRLQASLGSWTNMQTPASKPVSKSGPRPLMLNASTLITASPRDHVTRSTTSTPTPHPGQWTDVLRSKVQAPRHHEQRPSVSSISSTSSRQPRRIDTRSDWESDTSVSRIVPLRRATVLSPMALAFREPRDRSSSNSSLSERDNLSPPLRSRTTLPGEIGGRPTNGNGGSSTKGWDRIDVPDSPLTLPSSPPPRTPVSTTSFGNAAIRISNSERQRGSVVLSDSGITPLEASTQIKKPTRKASPPPSVIQPEDTSDSSTPSKSHLRIRSKRYAQRPPNLRVREPMGGGRQGTVIEQQSQSPNSLVAPDHLVDADIATTPKATDFPSMSPLSDQRSPRSPRSPWRLRKISTEGHEVRARKISNDARSVRPRKISASSDGYHRRTESAADEGDDEGYDDLLSAYESEEGSGWPQTQD